MRGKLKKMNQQQQNLPHRRDKVGPEPSSTFLLFFQCEQQRLLWHCANVQAHLSLRCSHMRLIQKYHKLAHKVWPEPSSISLWGGGCNQYQNLMIWPIYVSTSMTLESVNSATLKLRRRMCFSAVLYSSPLYFLVDRLQVMTSSRLAPHSKLVLQEPKWRESHFFCNNLCLIFIDSCTEPTHRF